MHIAVLISLIAITRAASRTDGSAKQPDELSDYGVGCYEKKDKGKAYNGLMTNAASGRTCQNWLVQHPHAISIEPMPDNGIGNHNYCRNPDGSESKPWCYTLDTSPDHAKEVCNVQVCSGPTRDFKSEAMHFNIPPVQFDLGPISFGSRGVALKPQAKLGVTGENFNVDVGVGDVRDGLKVGAKAMAYVEAHAEGHDVLELHNTIHCKTAGFDDALRLAKELLGSGGSAIKDIAQALGVKPTLVETILAGQASPDGRLAQLHLMAALQLGVSAEVRLGWCDTKGYKLIGAGGMAASGVGLGVSIFAGEHISGKSMKIILAISNFAFEYTLPMSPFSKLFLAQLPRS